MELRGQPKITQCRNEERDEDHYCFEKLLKIRGLEGHKQLCYVGEKFFKKHGFL